MSYKSYINATVYLRCSGHSIQPLASSEAAGHLQGGSIDSQGADHSHSGVSQRPGTYPRINSGSSFIWHSAAGHYPDADQTRSACLFCCSPIHL